jgi:hypothetical protein
MPKPSPALNSFTYEEYVPIIPGEVQTKLERIFTQGIYGWKRKAKIILRLQKAHKWVSDVEQELIDACEAPRGSRPTRSQTEITRGSLIRFLRSRTPQELERLCDRHNVSHSSFMRHNDHEGLYEALADEMLNLETVESERQ